MRKYDRITPVRKSLHWLPIQARIEFKILLLTWKSKHGKAPLYLSELLKDKQFTHELRQSNKNMLVEPPTYKTTCGDRAFEKAAPKLWNLLPNSLRNVKNIDTFKSQLKTHLFSLYYPEETS